jgi:transposase
MASGNLLASPCLEVEKCVSRSDLVEIHASCRRATASCPLCGDRSRRVHSRYVRTLADLPWMGVAVSIKLLVRRFRCCNDGCRRTLFAERLPDVAAVYARRTNRLTAIIELLGFVLGGEPGARAARKLSVATSPDTLIRAVRRAARPQHPTPHVLGVDDWAKRRGQRYGTILVDLERRCPIDLLPDRETATLVEWLREHPGIDVVTRDRARAYADAINQGAPEALQVADRWHLIKNMGEAVERVLERHRKTLKEAGAAIAPNEPEPAEPCPARVSSRVAAAEAKRQQRRERFEEARRLYSEGWSQRAIARKIGSNRRTVRRFLRVDSFPERARVARRRKVDRYAEYLRRRWDEGCHNATQLHQELKEQGFKGCATMVRSAVAGWRARGVTTRSMPTRRGGSSPHGPSPRQAMWLVTRDEEEVQDDERPLRAKILELCPAARAASDLGRQFIAMVRGRRLEELQPWLLKAKASGLAELASFAKGIEQDRAAVAAALSSVWSNGQVEGQVHRLKLIKRQMYGRGNFDLLRARVLYR